MKSYNIYLFGRQQRGSTDFQVSLSSVSSLAFEEGGFPSCRVWGASKGSKPVVLCQWALWLSARPFVGANNAALPSGMQLCSENGKGLWAVRGRKRSLFFQVSKLQCHETPVRCLPSGRHTECDHKNHWKRFHKHVQNGPPLGLPEQ